MRSKKLVRSILVGAMFSLCCGFGFSAAQAQETTAASIAQFADTFGASFGVQANLTYTIASSVEQKLDLYLPVGATGPVPLVVYFHGGGWVEGRKENAALYLTPYLQMGFAVANVGYRLGRVAAAPAAVEDTRCALRWLTRRAKEYKIDTSKIILTGGSAGGHLALITGMLPAGNPFDRVCATDDRERWTTANEPVLPVAAIINYFGITDVEAMLDGGTGGAAGARRYAVEWFGSNPNREAVARALSPLSYVRKDLPLILTIHGDADPIVPYSHGTNLHEAMVKAGANHQLLSIPGGNHGGFKRDEQIRIGETIRAFLKANGLMPAARMLPK